MPLVSGVTGTSTAHSILLNFKKCKGEQAMNRKAVAQELVKVAKLLAGRENFAGALRTAKMLVTVLESLQKAGGDAGRIKSGQTQAKDLLKKIAAGLE